MSPSVPGGFLLPSETRIRFSSNGSVIHLRNKDDRLRDSGTAAAFARHRDYATACPAFFPLHSTHPNYTDRNRSLGPTNTREKSPLGGFALLSPVHARETASELLSLGRRSGCPRASAGLATPVF